MLTNDQMVANRFARWARARKLVAAIQKHLVAGQMVQLATYTKCTRYSKPAHADMFRANKTGAYVQRGKHWDCIDGVHVGFFAK